MRVLILNWRDSRHPQAGGAEVYTHGVARRMVDRGHEVTIFAGAAAGLAASETLDGVRVVRRGGALTTRFAAPRWYRGMRDRFDVVVEEINTLPYWASRWADAPVALLMHQLAREVWWHEAPRALAIPGFLLEPLALRGCGRPPALVTSPSTRRDLERLGFPRGRVAVIPLAIDSPALPEPVRPDPHLVVTVSRLTPSKRIDHAIRAIALLRARGLPARLAVVGGGADAEIARLRAVAETVGVSEHGNFTGWLSSDARTRLVASARALTMTSAREGWGLAVTEANALGVPAVVYERPGLVDSTRAGVSGLVTACDPASLADGLAQVLGDDALHARLSGAAREWAARFTWERATDAFEGRLAEVAARGNGP
ncbi:MAG: glycosyltransferase family 4 protein [Thermoleophilia bacterium]|nr:glycosyltransferase family 4 protein [Thermoleophilia bacterium]